MSSQFKVIFITGGVISSLGKGITAASIGLILQKMGYKVNIKKLDPYLNIDPGTMSPIQHGEVFVTDDGMECDLDLGYYERFAGIETTVNNNVTSGKIYQTLLEEERKGMYLGKTVQTIPHVTNLIKKFALLGNERYDFTICEIGGTVGDIEALPFFEAARQIRHEFKDRIAFVHLTYLPYLKTCNELKTKPTQHSVKALMSIGISPDVIICRSSKHLDKDSKDKIALFCNVETNAVIDAKDASNIHEIPLQYSSQGLHEVLASKLKIDPIDPDLSEWEELVNKINTASKGVKIVVAGKYISNNDAYKSLSEALFHASITKRLKPEIHYVDTRLFDEGPIDGDHLDLLNSCDCIVVPGGFGGFGSEGKIKILNYTRVNNIPTLGICLGMQLMVIEFARNQIGIHNASSEEFWDSSSPNKEEVVDVVKFMDSFVSEGNRIERRTKDGQAGATMRLGSYDTSISPDTMAYDIYQNKVISERHRHRYEVSLCFEKEFSDNGLIFSGKSPDLQLPEILEIASHRFYIGVQFHPELKSQPLKPHPLFLALINASQNR